MTFAAAQSTDELGLVVSGDAQGVAGGDHAHDQPEHARGIGAAVDEVADEERLASFGVGCTDCEVARRTRCSQPSSASRVRSSEAQPWTSPMMSKGPWIAVRSFHGRSRTMAASISSAPRRTWTRRKPSRSGVSRPALSSRCWREDDVVAEVAVGPLPVALERNRLGDVEDDRVDEDVVLLGELDQRLPERRAGRWWRRRR